MEGIFEGLPSWAVPALIVHAALFLVLLIPTWIAFRKADVPGGAALALLFPVLGLIMVAIMLAIRVLPRAGWKSLLAILMLIPVVNLFLIWPLAFAKGWDRDRAPVGKRAPPAPPDRVDDEPRARASNAPVSDDNGGEPAAVPTRSGRRVRGRGATYREGPPPAASATAPPPPSLIADENPTDDSIDPRTLRPRVESAAPPKSDAPEKERSSAIEPPPPAPPKIEDIDPPAVAVKADAIVDESTLTPPPAAPKTETRAPTELEDDDAATVLAGGRDREDDRTVPAGKRWRLKGVTTAIADLDVVLSIEELANADHGLSVGRSARAWLTLADESISRNHARFRLNGDAIVLEDLDSMNGTWVNGKRLNPNSPVSLTGGMKLEFGKLKLEVSDR